MFDEFIHLSEGVGRRRQLGVGTPDTEIETGGNLDSDTKPWEQRARDRDRLEEFEALYQNGGLVPTLLDMRALMTFGTGAEFISYNDEKKAVPEFDGEIMTAGEFLNRTFDNLDLTLIGAGQDCYIYGDATFERITTKGGDFDRLEVVNPKTMEPKYDEKGDIKEWEQVIHRDGMANEYRQPHDSATIVHFRLKRIGRHPLGISILGQNWDQITRYYSNQETIQNAIEMHGTPKYHIKVGKEGGQAIDTRTLRRLKPKFKEFDELTNWLTGRDVDIEVLDTEGFKFDGITENDLLQLAAGLGIPLELANIGGDGLGTGKPAELRLQGFERRARAEQRKLADQFIEQVARDVLRDNSPFNPDTRIDLQFGDVVSDQSAVAEWLQQFKDYYTTDEVREKLGDGSFEGDEEELGPPAGADSGGDGLGDLFNADGGHDHPRNGATLSESSPERTGRELLETAEYRDGLTQEELVFLSMTHRIYGDPSRELFNFDESDVPQFVIDRIDQALASDVLFSDIESLPSGFMTELQTIMQDSLEEHHGWSLESIAENLMDEFPDLDRQNALQIAQNETREVVNKGRELGYEEQFEDLSEERFRWREINDGRGTEICNNLAADTKEAGGVPLPQLKDMVQEYAAEYGDGNAREWSPHINCRRTYYRVV